MIYFNCIIKYIWYNLLKGSILNLYFLKNGGIYEKNFKFTYVINFNIQY